MRNRLSRALPLGVCAAAVAVLLAACGSTDGGTDSPATASGTQPAGAGGPSLDPAAPIPAVTADAAATAKLPASVKADGKLVFGTEGGYPPFAYYGPDQKTVQGFGIDLSKAVAQALGVTAEFQVTSFANFIPGVSSGKYDVAVSGIYDNEARQASVDFVDYVKDGAITLVRRGNPDKLTPETLCGKSVAATAGTASATTELPKRSSACTAAGKPAIDIKIFPGAAESSLALVSGRVAAFTTGAATGYYQLTQTGGVIEPAGDPYNLAPVGLATKKGSAMTPAIQAGLQAVIDQGVYARILSKWNLSQSAVSCATINAAASC